MFQPIKAELHREVNLFSLFSFYLACGSVTFFFHFRVVFILREIESDLRHDDDGDDACVVDGCCGMLMKRKIFKFHRGRTTITATILGSTWEAYSFR